MKVVEDIINRLAPSHIVGMLKCGELQEFLEAGVITQEFFDDTKSYVDGLAVEVIENTTALENRMDELNTLNKFRDDFMYSGIDMEFLDDALDVVEAELMESIKTFQTKQLKNLK